MNSSLMTTSPAGRTTSRRHLDARSVCGSSSLARSISRARSVVAGESSLVRPPSSSWPTSARVCSIHGNAASIVAGVSRTPGRMSRANWRVGGNASLSDANAAFAVDSVGASSRIEERRFVCSLANVAVVRLRLVIRSLSSDS